MDKNRSTNAFRARNSCDSALFTLTANCPAISETLKSSIYFKINIRLYLGSKYANTR